MVGGTCESEDSSSTSTPYLGSSPPLLAPRWRRRTPEMDDMIPDAFDVSAFSASASSIFSSGKSISVCLSAAAPHPDHFLHFVVK